MTAAPSVLAEAPTGTADAADPRRGAIARDDRLKAIVAQHYAFLWRLLRRLGVAQADVEDAAQRCLWVIAQRLDDVPAEKEKSFLFGVALRVARAAHRQGAGRPAIDDERILDHLPADGPGADEALDERRARALLDALLESMPLDLRTVFVLYEIEELTMSEIAAALEIPTGTAASRLRRARETFEALSTKLQRRLRRKEGGR
jgi:RNA polymerase sigma-70 factor (ECF subfamily)